MTTRYILTQQNPEDDGHWPIVGQIYTGHGHWTAPCFWYKSDAQDFANMLDRTIGRDGSRRKFGVRETTLWEACVLGFANVVTAMINDGDGIDVNQLSPNLDRTPLMLACAHGHTPVVQALLGGERTRPERHRSALLDGRALRRPERRLAECPDARQCGRQSAYSREPQAPERDFPA